MPLTFQQAIAQERAREVAAFKSWEREIVRSRGVCIAGMDFGPFTPASDDEIVARAKASAARLNARLLSPAGRFLEAVVAVQKVAIAQGHDALANACETARSCWSRGMEDAAPAHRALDAMEALGADVEPARRALADLSQSEAA